jgi:ABC-type sugar transport system substrate-binding protein
MLKKALFSLIVLSVVTGAFVLAGDGQEEGKKVYTVGVIPEVIAEAYFIAYENGVRQAEKELENIQADWIGDLASTTPTANQKNDIQGFIDKRYDAILIPAIEPESYADT